VGGHRHPVAVDAVREGEPDPAGAGVTQLLHGLHGREPATADDRDAAAGPLHLREHVAGEEHRATGVLGLVQQGEEGLLHQRVEPLGGLVEDGHLRVVLQRLDQAELLLHAARPAGDGTVEVAGRQVEAPAQLVPPGRRRPLQVAEEPQVLGAGQLAVEPQLPRQVADPRREVAVVGERVQAEHPGPAGGRREQPNQATDRGRLARPVGAEEAEHLPLPYLQVEVLDPDRWPVALAQRLELDRWLRGHGV